MKGIILAGGSGTRLYPLTCVVSKQLLPVYDKPMICYPLATLMLLGVRDILIISTEKDVPLIANYLGDGSSLGIDIQYKVQIEPNGIAEAFILGEEFIGDESVCLILGDNIFYMGDQIHDIKDHMKTTKQATIFGYRVNDPERYGVIGFGGSSTIEVTSLEEKPKVPKSNYAAVGLYFYPNNVVQKTKKLERSARGELEITDLNKVYLEEKQLTMIKLSRGTAWMDAGTPESLLEASQYIGAIEHRQGLKIACLEEVAFRMGFINPEQMQKLINDIKPGVNYRTYLENVMRDI